MEKFDSLTSNRLLFDLASRLGSLEGYLYSENKVEKSYLSGWLRNIEQEFGCLAAGVRNEIQGDYLELLRKVHALLRRLYGEQDEHTAKVAGMISSLKS